MKNPNGDGEARKEGFERDGLGLWWRGGEESTGQAIFDQLIRIWGKLSQEQSALSLEGYLQKESPTVFKIFQRRYFGFRSKGEFLVWFKRKPTSADDDPKGLIRLLQITWVRPDAEQPRILQLGFPGRDFVLRAESKDLRDKWIAAIESVLGHLKRAARKKVVGEEDLQAWKWQDIKGEVSMQIRLENQKLLLSEEVEKPDSAQTLLVKLLGTTLPVIEPHCIHSFLSKKSFLSTQTSWYFLCSEFNLQDPQDDILDHKVVPALDSLQTRPPPEDSDSDIEQQQPNDQLVINTLFSIDAKSGKILEATPVVDIIGWEERITEQPFSLLLKIMHLRKDSSGDLEEEQSQLLLTSNFLTDIRKWACALEIVSNRYSYPELRRQQAEQRYQRYSILRLRLDDGEWLIAAPEKPEAILLNRENIKLAGFTFPLKDLIQPPKTSKQTVGQGEELVTSFKFKEGKQAAVIFAESGQQKIFRKKIKKQLKNMEQVIQPKGEVIPEINLSTYLLDRKIKESSGNIKVNFYEMMERDVTGERRAVAAPASQSLWDRFIGLFCGPPRSQDFLY